MQSAGVTLVKGDLNGIMRARRLSAATMSNMRQNLFFAFIYNAPGIPVASGVLYPLLGVILSPMLAAALALSSVSVIANALRLRRVALQPPVGLKISTFCQLAVRASAHRSRATRARGALPKCPRSGRMI